MLFHHSVGNRIWMLDRSRHPCDKGMKKSPPSILHPGEILHSEFCEVEILVIGDTPTETGYPALAFPSFESGPKYYTVLPSDMHHIAVVPLRHVLK
jgi:hypothetical protein